MRPDLLVLSGLVVANGKNDALVLVGTAVATLAGLGSGTDIPDT